MVVQKTHQEEVQVDQAAVVVKVLVVVQVFQDKEIVVAQVPVGAAVALEAVNQILLQV